MNFQTLHLIQFPVYVLHNDEVEERDGLLFCDTQIVDDKNVQGETLGIRRLKSSGAFFRFIALRFIVVPINNAAIRSSKLSLSQLIATKIFVTSSSI